MLYLIQFQISVYALIILGALYAYVIKTKVKSFSKWWIRITIMVSSVAIIADPLTWVFDGTSIPFGFYLEYATNFLVFLLTPAIAGLLITYVDFRIFGKHRRIFDRWFYQQGTIITFIILLINIKVPLYFSVDRLTNGYSSGNFIIIHNLLLTSSYIFILQLTLRNIKKITKVESLIFVLFFFLPILGMIFSGIDSKFHFSLTSVAILLLIVYIFLETAPAEEDFLTLVYNRSSYEKYLTYLIQKEAVFGLIMLDLDQFKLINDQYGHKKGDDVLIAFSKALKVSFHDESVIARLGGDEFAVVIEKNVDHIDERILDIKNNLLKNVDPVVQKLKFSYGYENHVNKMTIDELSVKVDKKMYLNKVAGSMNIEGSKY